MKQIFLDVTAKLATVPALKWIDEDKGQLNYERPPVLFPCALIDIQLPRTEDLQKKLQKCDGLVTVRLAFDFSGNSSNITPEAARLKSLEYYDIVEAVYEALQGWTGGKFNALSRTGIYQEKRPDQYKVINIPFSTQFLDDSALAG